MKISHSRIIEFLKENDIKFEEITASKFVSEQEYTFASTKKPILEGFYYISKEYLPTAETISKSIILTDAKKDEVQDPNNSYFLVENPQLVHYKLAALFTNQNMTGIHKTAIISKEAKISPTAYIGPFCIIENCEIGHAVQLISNVTLRDNVVIKENTIIEGNSVIGARGMAWIWDTDGKRIIQPQTGGVIIGANCIIGTDISIVRGSLSENTKVGDNTIIAHGTKIGHGSNIGNHVHIANNVSLAGNAQIGDRTFLGSACVVSSNVSIAPNCIVGAGAVVSKSVTIEYATLAGVPAKIIKTENYKDKPKGAPKPFLKDT